MLLRAAALVGAIAIALALQLHISPPGLLTTYPVVYQDDYLLSAAAVSFAEGGGGSLPFADSTPKLNRVLGGEGKIVPGISAGYSLALSCWFRAFGVGIVQARWFSYAMSGVLLGALVILAARWTNVGIAVAAALLLTLDSNFWYAARAVRPETFTVACYLAAGVLVSLRDPKWRNGVPELAGVLLGWGMTGHPCGVGAAPLVVALAFAAAGGKPGRRYLLRLLVPAALVGLAYAVFLAVNWEGVTANLRVHSFGRAIEAKGFAEKLRWEVDRYSTAASYFNTFAIGWGATVKRAACAGWMLLVLASAWKWWRGRRDPALLVALAPLSVAAALALLSNDHNPHYLVNFAPWFYLAAVAGFAAFLGLVPQRFRLAAGGCAGVLAMAFFVQRGSGCYDTDLAPYRQGQVVRYDEIETLLAENVEPGSMLIGNVPAWLAARRAGAEFVFNEIQLQWRPAYRRYPVSSRVEASHVAEYRVDVPLLAEIARSGMPIYYVLDMRDWGWNVYYPHGKYAPSFAYLEGVLEKWFEPVFRLHTRDRGLVALYRFAPGASPESQSTLFYVEREPHAVGPPIASRGKLPTGRVELPKQPLATYPLEPGRRYWLRARLHMEQGGFAATMWNGFAPVRYVDARQGVPVDIVARAEQAEGVLAMFAYPQPGPAWIDAVEVRELAPVTRPAGLFSVAAPRPVTSVVRRPRR